MKGGFYMKRKPIFLFTIIIGFCILCLYINTSTQKIISPDSNTLFNNPLSFFEVGSFDSLDGGKHISEYPLWSEQAYSATSDFTAPKTMSINFEGKQYKGTYWYTITEGFNTYKSNYYTFDNGYFAINSTTNELNCIVLPVTNDVTDRLSIVEYKGIANSIAKKYIKTDEYSIEILDGDSIISFCYYKYIDNIKTSDMLSISLDKSGNVASFSTSMLNRFNSNIINSNLTIEKKENLNSKETEAMVKDKVQNIYKNLSNVKQKTIKKTYVLLENGELGIVYTVSIVIVNNHFETSSLVEILIK